MKCQICGDELRRVGTHLRVKHNLSVLEYEEKYDPVKLKHRLVKVEKVQESTERRSVECQICGGSFWSLFRHIKKHGLNEIEYRRMFPGHPLASPHLKTKIKKIEVDISDEVFAHIAATYLGTKSKWNEIRCLYDFQWHRCPVSGRKLVPGKNLEAVYITKGGPKSILNMMLVDRDAKKALAYLSLAQLMRLSTDVHNRNLEKVVVKGEFHLNGKLNLRVGDDGTNL